MGEGLPHQKRSALVVRCREVARIVEAISWKSEQIAMASCAYVSLDQVLDSTARASL